MKAIKIGNNQFINESLIAAFTYTPSETRPKQKNDSYGGHVKDVDDITESNLVLTLSTGAKNTLHGEAADTLYKLLTAKLA